MVTLRLLILLVLPRGIGVPSFRWRRHGLKRKPGLPTVWGRSKRAALGYVRDAVLRKIQGWKQASLSPAGKEIMIKAVAMALPAYPMSIFKFPKSLCVQINNALAKFWWGTNGDKGIHWKHWDLLCNPKSVGGLGFRSLQDFNLALLAKQGWRLLQNPSAKWAQVLKYRYFPNTSFMEAKQGPSSSWVWASLLAGRDVLFKGSLWRVGNGHSIHLWNDKWIPNTPSFSTRFPSLLPVSQSVNTLLDFSTLTWNLESLQHVLTPGDSSVIQAIPIFSELVDDKLVWPHVMNGEYSVRSGYHVSFNSNIIASAPSPHSSHVVPRSVWTLVWTIRSLPKIRIFLWRVVSNVLATKQNLFRRHLGRSPLCPFCSEFPESVEHLLLSCPWVVQTWFLHPLGYRIPLQSLTSFDQWLSALLIPLHSELSRSVVLTHISFLLWHIWKHRCDCIFNYKVPNPTLVATRAFVASSEFLTSRTLSLTCNRPPPPPPPPPPPWTPPCFDFVKINTDASWDKQSLQAGLAVIVRNSSGELLHGKTRIVRASSILLAETLALYQAVLLALCLNFQKVIFEMDSFHLVHLLNDSHLLPDWIISPLVHYIREITVVIPYVSWVWTSRNANQVADHMASLASRRMGPSDWVNHPPSTFTRILLYDAGHAPT
ncbi:putative ribonuclease H-like domain, reverse transcriptase zinc-binding domain-containing protein [Rosa chinensis]|uniref:Putative ribonuclease H-like domain, reverse transcriptase zinc-binding domain-containing protein n=1 Tax=Rosa chinensis TaxID=74649 RepID=A0A2P6QCP1_ROSCH|nr:putative ribonuclease H-like domain, reverse transcriptase zinc-binding domain-containing protein [Rosa chinensis]